MIADASGVFGLSWSSLPITRRASVYRLLSESGEVLYVGMSKNVLYRIGDHVRGAVIPFAAAEFSPCTQCDVAAAEAMLIREHEPPFNTMLTPAWGQAIRGRMATRNAIKIKNLNTYFKASNER
jgi:hypothetical protein